MMFSSLLTLNLLFPAALFVGPADPAVAQPPVQRIPSSAQAPLPPPLPPVDPSTIERGPWRGKGWFGSELGIGGPLDGGANFPSSSRVSALGWGLHLGYRALPWLGVGLGFHRAPHDLVQIQLQASGVTYLTEVTGYLNSYDLLVMRFFLPTPGRVQPWMDVSGGLAVVQAAYSNRPGGVGGQFRTGVGVDFWVHQQISLDLGLHYRLTSVNSGPGHLMRGSMGITFHW